MPEFLDSEILSMVFDVVLILSVIGLWILWWQQVQQRKNIESMLVEASTQLQEATLMLNQALVQIQDLQGIESSDLEVHQTAQVDDEDLAKSAFREKVEKRVESDVQEETQPTAKISQVAQMLRLQREGMSPEKISEKLDVPLAQIKLMLMLQSSPKL